MTRIKKTYKGTFIGLISLCHVKKNIYSVYPF